MALHKIFIRYKGLVIAFFVISITACSETSNESVSDLGASQVAGPTHLEVYKRASCGCCRKWVTHVKNNGFQTNAQNLTNLDSLKRKYGIERKYRSCHTAVSEDGFVFEGHIPAKFIQQFLDDTPDNALGLAVPAMPTGSPGMEFGSKFTPYRVLLLKANGSFEIYAEISTYEEQF